jgi:uncharacterized protein (DUF2062 family)
MKSPIHRRWRKIILHLVGHEDPPEKVAAAFALGVAISFFTPLTGFHTLIALGLAFLLRLSKVDVLMGSFVVNPWTVVPVITFEHFIGKKLLHLSPELSEKLPWRQILHRNFWTTLRGRGWNDLVALAVGSLVLSAVAAAVTHFLVLAIIQRYERTHPHLSARLRKINREIGVSAAGTDESGTGSTPATPRRRTPEAEKPREERRS